MARCSSGSMTTFSASRIWSLVGMRLLSQATRLSAAASGTPRAPAAEARQHRPAARLERTPASSPSVAAISRSADAVGEHAEDREVVRRSSRSPSARSARGSSAGRGSPRSASSSARGGADFGSTRVGAGDRGPDRQPGVGERGVDDHPRRLGQRARAQAQREAVVVGQVQVDQRDRRARVGDRLEALARRGRGGGDAQAVLVLDQPAQSGADGGVIVDDARGPSSAERCRPRARRRHPGSPRISSA